MRFLLPLFLALPFAELWLMIKIGAIIGAFTTIILLILSGMAGATMLRWQGAHMLWKVQERLQNGEQAADEVFNGLLLSLAGVLLIVPGFITDVFALFLLIAPLRRLLARKLLQPIYMNQTIYEQTNSKIIEGEYRREDDSKLN